MITSVLVIFLFLFQQGSFLFKTAFE